MLVCEMFMKEGKWFRIAIFGAVALVGEMPLFKRTICGLFEKNLSSIWWLEENKEIGFYGFVLESKLLHGFQPHFQ